MGYVTKPSAATCQIPPSLPFNAKYAQLTAISTPPPHPGQARRRLRSRGARQDPRLDKVTLRLHVNLALRERVRSLARLR